MKKLLSLIALSTCLCLPACNKSKPATGNSQDGINDALDRRPSEKVRDAAEDTSDAVKDAGKDLKDAVKGTNR